MTLALFILGLLLILGIARYNESNKLFWTLSIAYILGFACTKMVYDSFSTDEQSGPSLDQAYPTQGLATTGEACICFFDNVSSTTPTKETSSLVSQVFTPDYIEHTPTLSDVSGVTQGLTIHALPHPPNSVSLVDTS